MAKLPKAVQEAAKRANEIVEGLKKEAEGEETTEEVVTETPAPEEPKLEPETKPVEKVKDEDYWNHRLKTVEGIARAQARKDAEKEFKSQIEQLQQQIAELKKAQQSAAPAQFDLSGFLSDKEIEDLNLDKDHLKVISRIAQKASQDAVERAVEQLVSEKLAPVEQKVKANEEDNQRRREQLFWGAIDTAVPEWSNINSDERFLVWLGEVDPLIGAQRQALLTAAQESLDAQRVIAIFKAFLGTISKPNPQEQVQRKPAPAPEPVASTPAVTSKDGSVSPSQSEIREFYKRVSLGKISAKEKEAFEKRLRAAFG